jgi:uncharacterized protein (TIGR02246 family)
MPAKCNWSKAILAATCIATAGAGGFLAVRFTGPALADERVETMPIPNDPKTAEDEKAIHSNQAAYVKAFNAGDAKGTAGFWALDGEFVDADGKSFKGRSAIEKEFASFFAESKALQLEVSTDSIRFVSPGVALESGTSRVTHGSDGAWNVASYQIVYTKRDGRWQFASVRELARVPSSNYEQLRDLEWLVGNWAAKSGSRSLQLSCEWTGKRNFLLRRYVFKDNDSAARTGIQIIGWDPVAGAIRSWIFDSDGGFGSERWTKDGKRWVLEASGVARDGAEITATNIVTPIDHDNFNWQSVKRGLNQVRLPDTAIIKATRIKSRS